jgi:ferredoxin-like protein FixX
MTCGPGNDHGALDVAVVDSEERVCHQGLNLMDCCPARCWVKDPDGFSPVVVTSASTQSG